MDFVWQILDSYPLQLIVAAHMFASFFTKRRGFPARLFLHGFPMLVIYAVGIHMMPTVQNYFMDKMILLIPGLYMVMGLLWCYECGFLDAVYCTASALPTQNILYNLYWILKLQFGFEEGSLQGFLVSVALMLPIYVIIYFVFAVRMKEWGEYEELRKRLVGNALVVLIFVVLFNMRVPESDMEQVVYLAYIMGDVLALIVQYGLYAESALERQRAMVELLLYKEQQQQRITEDNVELINRKCHDLKHQIAGLRTIESEEERSAYIDEIEQAVMIYESTVRTGNKTLDLILMEKQLYCREHGIDFSCAADGASLAGMNPMDIYALFGNALDNAIESVAKEPEESRIILLHAGSRSGALIIHFENYLGHPVELKNGLPKTTKEDSRYHGYGMLSIRHIVEKYHGTMSIRTAGDRFCLDIMIPGM